MKKRLGIYFILIVLIFIALGYLGGEVSSGFYKDLFVLMSGAGVILALYVFNRVSIFRKKLDLALNHILENNFRTGISLKGRDECGVLSSKFNAVIDRINEYDRLRETRVDTLNRLLMSLNRSVQNGVMILDLETSKIKLNKAAQDAFNISQDELSIESVIKLEANSGFNKIYEDIISRRVNTICADLELFLPVLKAKAQINLKMFAIKDKDERLTSILCVFSKS